jgi:hypothetical protein
MWSGASAFHNLYEIPVKTGNNYLSRASQIIIDKV